MKMAPSIQGLSNIMVENIVSHVLIGFVVRFPSKVLWLFGASTQQKTKRMVHN